MLGGYQILDLRGIDLEIGTVASDITDSNVLNQLLKLRDYIDKAYNFSKPLENQLKPVLIRFRDKKANEKTEGAVFGELSVVDNYYSFKVTARISGALILTINVTFEEVANGYGNYEWVIDDATILLEDVIEALHGNISLDGDLDVSGDVEIGGDLDVTGDANIFEKIKDADGHARFIEGDIEIEDIEGVTQVYGKWALSGTHLLIVVAGQIADETVMEYGKFADINLPQWILDKIYPVYATAIERKAFDIYASNGASQEVTTYLIKSTNKLEIETQFTATADRNFRFAFDLLIDNNQE